jgi:NitT/TauT family transport system substrate-binding protein
MSTFAIQPHGRLQEWVADEKGYFCDEGLEYALNRQDRTLGGTLPAPIAGAQPGEVADVLAGAFESYEAGQGRKGAGAGDISCACHWTVNQAAKVEHGRIWGKAYSIADGAILIPPDSDIQAPEDLAGRDVAVGYHSGSHYSAQQALEVFLAPEDIRLKFAGPPWSRIDAALARQVVAVNVWGPQRYLLEQQGFRRLVDTTFMITFMYPAGTDEDHIERYIRALQRAQMDIDLEPERYKHHFLKEIPERYHHMIDVRRFGPGERIVFLPYSKEMFDKTQSWIHERKLFDVGPEVGVGYDVAVCS